MQGLTGPQTPIHASWFRERKGNRKETHASAKLPGQCMVWPGTSKNRGRNGVGLSMARLTRQSLCTYERILFLYAKSSSPINNKVSWQLVNIHTSIKISLYFFGFTLILRSRSNVDLDEFFNKQSCIDPVDLRLVCKYCHGLYFYL